MSPGSCVDKLPLCVCMSTHIYALNGQTAALQLFVGLAPSSRAFPVLRAQDRAVRCGPRTVSGSGACCLGVVFIALQVL